MKNHIKVYFDYFDYTMVDFIPCECCGAKAVDIHHIVCKGIGGVKKNRLNIPDNLMATCRNCHLKYGDNKLYYDFIIEKHSDKMKITKEKLTKVIESL